MRLIFYYFEIYLIFFGTHIYSYIVFPIWIFRSRGSRLNFRTNRGGRNATSRRWNDLRNAARYRFSRPDAVFCQRAKLERIAREWKSAKTPAEQRERRISRRGRMVIIAWRQTEGGVPMLRTRCVSLLPILSRGRRKNRDGSRSSSRTTYSFPLTLSLPLLSRAREKCSRKIVRILPLEFPSPDGTILTHL